MDLTNTARKSPVGPHAPTFPLPTSNYRNQPNDIWSADLNVRPPKVNIYIPNSPRLLDSPQELGAGSCIIEAKQYSAYRFRLPPTPGMRLVQFKHDQQGQQWYGPQSTRTGLRHPGTLSCCHTYTSLSFPRPVSNFLSFHIVFHVSYTGI